MNLFIASHYVFKNVALYHMNIEYIMITYTTGCIRPVNNFHPTRRLGKKLKADNKNELTYFCIIILNCVKKIFAWLL